MVTIMQAVTEEHMQHAQDLFIEYFDFLHVLLDQTVSDLNNIPSLAGYQSELSGSLGKYVPPEGRLLLAYDEAELAGCVVLTKTSERVCEVKRLWVRPPLRGKKISRALVETLIKEAGKIGYTTIVLSSVEAMKEAISLYGSVGFEKCDSFYDNPEDRVPNQIFMKLELV
jgi:putative acetyltransferase